MDRTSFEAFIGHPAQVVKLIPLSGTIILMVVLGYSH